MATHWRDSNALKFALIRVFNEWAARVSIPAPWD
jgi:hypothetical protein